MSKDSNKDKLSQLVDQVPTEPGCYLWKNAADEILYVGKAKNLRARMRQYVRGEDERAKIPLMMSEVAGFDYLVCESEHEALVLEMNLIQQHHPRFNVDLRDNKSYPYIALTKGDVYPAIKYTREKHREDTRYFGPYTDARSAKQAIDVVRKLCPMCVANCAEWKRVKRLLDSREAQAARNERNAQTAEDTLEEEVGRGERVSQVQDVDSAIVEMICAANGRPCFDFHVGRGPGVCTGSIRPKEYANSVAQVEHFLSGHKSEFIRELEADMNEAAFELDFERAARLKRRLEAIRSLESKQQVVFESHTDADVLGFYREETIAGACVFLVREGRVVRTCDFILDKGLDVDEEEIVGSFLKRYYDQTDDLPLEVCIPCELQDADALEGWLGLRRGRKVHLRVPQRGEKAHLLDLASNNARHALMRYELKTGYEDKRTNEALLELESALALDEAPLRIECFDISTIHGKHTVASMVVFTGGKPDKSAYRRFKIQTPLTEANDVASMAEVLGRRFAPERLKDARFGKLPNLLIVDGGKPQLNAAVTQLKELGVELPVVGLAKSDEEIFVTWDESPVVLPNGSASLYLVKQVRDEAHRFAISFHRELRNKAMTASILDEIPGIGPIRKKALRRSFGSMKRLRGASLEEIMAVPGIPEAVARELFETLRVWESELEQPSA